MQPSFGYKLKIIMKLRKPTDEDEEVSEDSSAVVLVATNQVKVSSHRPQQTFSGFQLNWEN